MAFGAEDILQNKCEIRKTVNGEVWRSWTVEREGMRVVIKVQDPEKVLLGFC